MHFSSFYFQCRIFVFYFITSDLEISLIYRKIFVMFDLLTLCLLLMNNRFGAETDPSGNIILDTGSKHEEMPMMPMINPFAFYPIQQHHAPPQMVIHPIYMEDHSAMGKQQQHHEQEQPQHQEYQPQHHEEQHHYQPQNHEEMVHYQHQEHHEEPQQEHHDHHQQEEEHHEPQQEHYEHEGHHHGGYETHPIMSMMMHGSGQQPIYNQQQMATMQAFQQPMLYHPGLQQDPHGQQAAAYRQQQIQQHHNFQQALQAHQQQIQEQQANGQQHQAVTDQAAGGGSQTQQQGAQDVSSSASSQQTVGSKPNGSSLSNEQQSRPTNALMAIIKPLFKRNQNKQKKP